MIDDKDFDCGPSIGLDRQFSVQHLQHQNVLRRHTPLELVELIETRELDQGNGLCSRLKERLQRFPEQALDDIALIEDIILKGGGIGLSTSPYVCILADIYWHAAALLLQSYGCDHVNDFEERISQSD